MLIPDQCSNSLVAGIISHFLNLLDRLHSCEVGGGFVGPLFLLREARFT